jgi:UDP-N-acetylmuramoylalanine--D-glutamate ligase
MSGALFAELAQIPIVGVTGTRGKSTVTHMVHHVLTQMTEGARVLLGGNVRGVSNLQLLKEVDTDSLAVMELDSWQLQGFGERRISPQISVFTSFMEDHLNYYKHDMDAYFADKANIFLYQREEDVLVTTEEVFERIRSFMGARGFELGQEVRLVDTSVLPDDMLLSMPGEHNRLNAALAYEALKATGLPDEEIFDGLASFPGVPGRLEYLGEKDGVRIYNDNNATTPTATRAGIEAVQNGKNVILIMGGAGKELDMKPLSDVIPRYCKTVVLIPGTGTESIQGKINGETVSSLEEAVGAALKNGEPGDVILFSPAFASFGMFKNEYDRGDRFVAAVRSVLDAH